MADELASMLEASAGRDPAAIALLTPGRAPLDYEGLWAQLEAIAVALHDAGLGASSRVATVLPNGPDAALAAVGVACTAGCVPLNPAYGEAELRFYLEDAHADAVIVEAGRDGPARRVADALGLALLELVADGPAGRFTIAARRGGRVVPADRAERQRAALVLHTSGTTARPKVVPLTQANLAASAQAIARHLRLLPTDRGLNVMPLFHIHGLVGSLLASLAAGASVVCTPGFDDEAFFDWVAEFDPSWYTAVPTIHQSVLGRIERYRLVAPEHRFRFVRSSSASLPPAVYHALEAQFGAPVVEAYGMTEASHQMASNPLPPLARKPGSVGVAAGAEIAILDPQGQRLPAGQTGEIAIRGAGVTAGYEANPEANAASFHDGWLRTGDLGCLDTDGYLRVVGRIKEIVNRGGEKVSPREVDEALLEHPAVAQAAAFAIPHPTLGEDLVAAVVRRAGVDAREVDLRAFLFGRIAEYKIPSRIVFVDAIPKGSTGKIQRATLHQSLASQLAVDAEAPVGAVEQAIADAIQAVLGVAGVGRHDNFFALGGDSLSGARVVARVNDALGLEMHVTDLFRYPSVAQLGAQAHGGRDIDETDEARLLEDLDALSDEEVARLLARYEAPERPTATAAVAEAAP